MIVDFSSKSSYKYTCNFCDYSTCRKSQYDRHLLTAKHRKIVNDSENSSKPKDDIYECVCGKTYKYDSGYYRHKKSCTSQNQQISDEIINQPVQSLDTGLVIELLKQNQEFKELMIDQNKQLQQSHEQNNELQKQLLEAVKDGKTINNNNTINNTTNNRFNLNVFLNETCKDAINLNDFIQSIVLNIDDFINTGEVGYVKGISSIMVERIRDMEPHIRPIHCTDLKREIVYVKDSNIWAKEDANKTHLRKAIRIVADKNKNLVHSWIEENPNYEILDTPECDKFFEYTKASLGGYGKEEDNRFENKIISNVIKEVVIDKKMLE
jgi:hypothetical protein